MTTKFDTTSFPDQWIVDGGATAHFTGHVTDFTTRQPITPRLVKGMNLFATATGKVNLEVPSTSKLDHTTKICTITLHNVLYVPDLINKGEPVTRLLSQRAAHKASTKIKPTFIDSLNYSVIDLGQFFVRLDQ
jgi:hypothetical protein